MCLIHPRVRRRCLPSTIDLLHNLNIQLHPENIRFPDSHLSPLGPLIPNTCIQNLNCPIPNILSRKRILIPPGYWSAPFPHHAHDARSCWGDPSMMRKWGRRPRCCDGHTGCRPSGVRVCEGAGVSQLQEGEDTCALQEVEFDWM